MPSIHQQLRRFCPAEAGHAVLFLFVFYSSTCLVLFVPLLVRTLDPTPTPWAIMFLLCLTLLVILLCNLVAGFSNASVGSIRPLISRHVCIVFIVSLGAWTFWSATQFFLLLRNACGWRVKAVRALVIVHLFACGSALICAHMIKDRQCHLPADRGVELMNILW